MQMDTPDNPYQPCWHAEGSKDAVNSAGRSQLVSGISCLVQVLMLTAGTACCCCSVEELEKLKDVGRTGAMWLGQKEEEKN